MKIVALDTETTGVGWGDEAFALSIWEDNRAAWEPYYYDWREDESEWTKAGKALAYYVDAGFEFIFHNAKFDMRKINMEFGVVWDDLVIHDTHCLAHLLDEHQQKGLKSLARKHLGETTDEDEVLKVVRRQLKVKKEDGYYPIPRHVIEPYAIKDAEYTFKLFRKFYPIVKANPDLYELYCHEMELTKVLMYIEDDGMKMDMDYIKDQIAILSDTIYTLYAECVELSGNLDFNPNSVPQLTTYFNEKGITVDNVQADTLAKVDDPLAKAVVSLRKAKKLQSTYFANMQNEADKFGVLHPNFRQHGTVTGRMSSGTAEA